jgi:hypothetical protein
MKIGDLIEVKYNGEWVHADILYIDKHDEVDVYLHGEEDEVTVDGIHCRAISSTTSSTEVPEDFDDMDVEWQALQVSKDSSFKTAEESYQLSAGSKSAQHTPTIADLVAIGVL